jgi:hypothetical protein
VSVSVRPSVSLSVSQQRLSAYPLVRPSVEEAMEVDDALLGDEWQRQCPIDGRPRYSRTLSSTGTSLHNHLQPLTTHCEKSSL